MDQSLNQSGRQTLRKTKIVATVGPACDDVETLAPEDYVGDSAFHAQAYVQPSVLATICAIVVSDVIVRPIGSLLTIFGARGTGERMDEWGKGLIEKSFRARFL